MAPALRLQSLLPGARAALVVCSAGRALFQRFDADARSRDGQPHPLDRFTRAAVEAAAVATLAPAGVRFGLGYPFVDAVPVIPFQRLGRAAGVGAPGPLGLQIHPVYGPWWAYRALVAVDVPAGAAPPVGDGCAGCDAPCVAACPGAAVQRSGFVVLACHAHRRVAEPCQLSCAARLACVRGPEHRYSAEQLAFHMRAARPR